MITYEDIYDMARKERYSDQLQSLAKNFIEEVADYLKGKKEIISKEDNVFSDVIVKTKKQFENAITLFKELMLRRRKKILNLVLIAAETGISKQDFKNLLVFEKALFKDLTKCIEVADKRFNEVFNGEGKGMQKDELIVFKENVEEFVGLNGEKMGPFSEGDSVEIAKEIAKILVDDGKAEVVGE